MKKIFNILVLLVVSFVIGFCFNIYTRALIITPVDGFNQLNLTFAYLKKEANFKLYAYDENNIKKADVGRFYSINKHSDSNNSKIDLIESEPYVTLIPFEYSHKIEIEFEGIDNYVLISKIELNDKTIPLDEFAKNVSSKNNFKIGTIKGVDGILVNLQNQKVVFDVTNAINPLTLTQNQIKTFDDDYVYLNQIYLGLCILLTFIILYSILKLIQIIGRINSRSDDWVLNSTIVTIYLFVLIAIVMAINASYYLLTEQSLTYLNSSDGMLSNVVIFEQNLIPLLIFTITPLFLSLIVNNKFFKFVLGFISLVFVIILMVDNCIFNVLGTRLNFNFGGAFANQYQYFYDFIYKFISSESGQLMLFGLVATFLVLISSFFSQRSIPKKLTVSYIVILFFIGIWGFWPIEARSSDFKFANVFQLNGYGLNSVGNFQKKYEDPYFPRDNLNIDWETKKGLNKQQNVILVLVESFGCNFTYMCGNGPSYMPKLEALAKNNLLYDNYYSSIPSTSVSYLSIVKSVPSIQTGINKDLSKYTQKLYSENDLVAHFKDNGYSTKFISSTDLVFDMDTALSFSKYDEVIDAQSTLFKDIHERFVFNSVTDNQMFNGILKMLKHEKGKFLYITKTASNHAPYDSPLGLNNIHKAFEYTDNEVDLFVKELEKIGYFENGIVVLVGDHHAWSTDNMVDASDHPTFINKVPLIIIDGKNKGVINHTVLAHSSLGIMLQSMELPTYKFNQFNVDPLNLDNGKDELVFGYDYQRLSYLSLKYGDRETDILLSGNETKFLKPELFTEKEQSDILGYISWFR